MATAELLDQVKSTQSKVEAIFDCQEKAVCSIPSWVKFLSKIAETSDETVKASLGDTGRKLKKFASRVDLKHPDLEVFVESLPKCALEVFKFCAEAAEDGKVNREGELDKWTESKTLLRAIQQPRTRLLANVVERKDQRAVKKNPHNIGLKSLFTTGENAFFSQPINFNRFARFSTSSNEEMAELEKKQNKFANIGMAELAGTFGKRMKSLQESMSAYCGFYRIRPDEASVTLARMHGFRWSDSGNIIVPSKYFDNFKFWADKKSDEAASDDPKAEAIKKTLILNTKFAPLIGGSSNFFYQSRMYPLPVFGSIPPSTQKIIDKVEEFDSLGGHPFFDYLWVLVPSINVNNSFIRPNKDVDHWTITDAKGVVHEFDNAVTASTFLDTMLVDNNIVFPIVVGERDGKCYFVSMWR